MTGMKYWTSDTYLSPQDSTYLRVDQVENVEPNASPNDCESRISLQQIFNPNLQGLPAIGCGWSSGKNHVFVGVQQHPHIKQTHTQVYPNHSTNYFGNWQWVTGASLKGALNIVFFTSTCLDYCIQRDIVFSGRKMQVYEIWHMECVDFAEQYNLRLTRKTHRSDSSWASEIQS